MVRGIKGADGYLNSKSTDPDVFSDSQESAEDNCFDISNIKKACKKNKDDLKNRYYRYTPVF